MAYPIIADLHTHSIASTHAYSTISEMVAAAKRKGLKAIAITDHASALPGAPGPLYFTCLAHTIPLYYQGVLTLAGVEANVLDFEGKIDVPQQDLDRLDWVVASIHKIGLPGLENPTVEKTTALWLEVAKNPHVNVIGHSGDPEYPYDYERVIPEFGAQGKLVEINAHSFKVRPENLENCTKIAQLCKKHGVMVVVDSDAHFETDVGNHAKALQMLAEIDFPQELVVNASEARLHEYLSAHSKVFSHRVDNRLGDE